MTSDRKKAAAEFRRTVKWIVLIGIVATILALLYLGATGDLYLHMVIAVIGGVFLSVVLGCGLMAAAFFSDKSGHDQHVTDATKHGGE